MTGASGCGLSFTLFLGPLKAAEGFLRRRGGEKFDPPTPVSGKHWRLLGSSTIIERRQMSKEAMREETERLVREAIERKNIVVKQGNTRIEEKCGKCGAPNRISAPPGQSRIAYTCKECGAKQKTL